MTSFVPAGDRSFGATTTGQIPRARRRLRPPPGFIDDSVNPEGGYPTPRPDFAGIGALAGGPNAPPPGIGGVDERERLVGNRDPAADRQFGETPAGESYMPGPTRPGDPLPPRPTARPFIGVGPPSQPAYATGGGRDDYMAAAKEAQQAIADQGADDLQRVIGERLGNLNSIGALRTGAAPVALREAGEDYSKQVSRAGAANALQYLQMRDEAQNAAARNASLSNMNSLDRQERAMMFEEDQRRWESEFGEGRRRFDVGGEREDRRFGSEFNEGRRRFDTSLGFDRERAGRGDYESDREFGRQTGRDTRADYESDREARFVEGRATREDFNTDREFQQYVTETDRSFGEDRRRWEQERNDAIRAAQKKRQASMWGAIGRFAPAVIGGIGGGIIGGPAGAVAGAKGGLALGGAFSGGR